MKENTSKNDCNIPFRKEIINTWQEGRWGQSPMRLLTVWSKTAKAEFSTSSWLTSSNRIEVRTLMMTCSRSSVSVWDKAESKASRSVAVTSLECFKAGRDTWKAAQNLVRLLSPTKRRAISQKRGNNSGEVKRIKRFRQEQQVASRKWKKSKRATALNKTIHRAQLNNKNGKIKKLASRNLSNKNGKIKTRITQPL